MTYTTQFVSYPKTTLIGSEINFDVLTAQTQMYTAPPTAKFNINFRGNQITTLKSQLTNSALTAKLIFYTGARVYLPNLYKVDGAIVYPDFYNNSSVISINPYRIAEYEFDFSMVNNQVQVTCRAQVFAPGSQKDAVPISKR